MIFLEFKDYYKILEIKRDATEDEIKKKYRNLAKKYHPDKNQGNKTAEEKFKDISEAYDVLSSKDKKLKYDELLKYGYGNQGGFRQTGNSYSTKDFEGIFSGLKGKRPAGFDDSYSDIFDMFFGQGTESKENQYNSKKGENIEITTTISLEQAIKGGTLKLGVPQKQFCDLCNGTGAKPVNGLEVCKTCMGRGSIIRDQRGFSINTPCPTCAGKGKTIKAKCEKCTGSGIFVKKKQIKVEVPKGVRQGHKIRIIGEGNKGKGHGAPGNLIVKLNIREDKDFVRDGNNIDTKVEISFIEALKGIKKKIRTPHGHVLLTIPKGIQPGTKMKLKGKGIEYEGLTGDLLVEILVKIPKTITEVGIELLEKLEKECIF